MMMMALVVVGIFSFRRLPIDEFPEVDIPVVTVQTLYPGASPEAVEREITEPLERAFNPVEGVDRITSVSLEGVSQIILEFELDREADPASQDVRAKIEEVRRDLPVDAEAPIVQKFDFTQRPIVSLALASEEMSVPALTRLAEETIRRRLETVTGVGNVQIAGGLTREVRVFLDPRRMEGLSVSTGQVMAALRQQNLEVPAGRVERGPQEELVRVLGRIEDPAQFEDVIVATRQGQPVRLRQVAEVVDATEEERSLALVNGDRAVSLDILKVSGANTVAVAEEVKAEIEALEEELPAGVEIQIVRDNSVYITSMVEDVIFELMLGALLTILVVMIFLNDPKATTITSFALPVSVISAFILMNALGFTLNMLTLMALSLSIGILIDDAIVVIENIVRHRENGEDHFTAARLGAREIFLAVLATTSSIVAVFAPVAFMGGIVGRFFFQFGLTVAWAVSVSFLVSFTLTPMLSAWWGVEPHRGEGGNPLARAIGGFNRWFDRQADRYRGAVDWALRYRKTTLLAALGAFVAALALFPFIGGAFMPDSDNGEFSVTFETPEGSSLSYTEEKALQIETRLRELDEVDYVYTTIGAGATGTVTEGNAYVKLVPAGERARTQAETSVLAREALRPIFGVDVSILEAGGPGGDQKPLQVNIRGPDVAELQSLANALLGRMEAIPGIVDVESSVGEPRPEYRIHVNRDLANELELDIGQIAGTLRPLLAGQTVTTWEDPSGEERDVVVQVAPEHRASVEDLSTLPLARPGGGGGDAPPPTVPLGQVARIERGEAPAQIDRQDLQRVVTVSANTLPDLAIAQASSAVARVLPGIELPDGYSISFGGETEALQETIGYVVEALLLAIILIFLILASQFESFTQPFAIMLSLPLSLVGVMLALLVTNDTMNMMSMIGVIMLMGLVTKNAILLVDQANERREEYGEDRHSALVEAGRIRLRPILMTTLAMIFGMLPISLALGQGGGFRAPMARAVIGGLITSTLLTLIVVPVAYTYMDDLGQWLKHHLMSREREREIEREMKDAGFEPASTWGDD
jgi:HAE1 family hydrophobic/amphiphilic exporter-1